MHIPRPPSFLAATLAIFTVSLIMSVIVFFNGTSQESNSSELAFDSAEHGGKPDAILTMIVTPKALGRSKNANSRRQMRFIFDRWANLNQVDFIVVSHDDEVLQIAKEFGLASVQPHSGNDVEDLAYRSILRMVDQTLPIQTQVVGFSNGDILFDETLPQTVQAVLAEARNRGWANFAIEGQRTNVDVPSFYLNGRHQSQLKQRFQEGKLFQSDAQDYFIFNRGINLVWDCFPPFLVGGVYFDNWFSGLLQSRQDIEVVDASETLKAYHINHGKGRHMSHENAASMINLMIGIDAKNYISRGSVHDSPWITSQSDDGIVVVSRTLAPSTDNHYSRYATCHARGKPIQKKGEINRLSE